MKCKTPNNKRQITNSIFINSKQSFDKDCHGELVESYERVLLKGSAHALRQAQGERTRAGLRILKGTETLPTHIDVGLGLLYNTP